MRSVLLSIGDELVLGQTVDTNAAWLSRQLSAVGCAVVAHVTVSDDQPAIEQAIRDALPRCECLIITGGIGPTDDDLTRQALAAVMDVPLEMNQAWLVHLETFFQKRGRPMPRRNTIQAMIPLSAELIWNTAGTAAGIHATIASASASSSPSRSELQARPIGRILVKMERITREQAVEALNLQKLKGGKLGELLIELGHVTEQDVRTALAAQEGLWPAPDRPCEVFVLPGVPKEMMLMFQRDVLPQVERWGEGSCILSRTLHTFGMGESAVAERLGALTRRDRNPLVGTTVSDGIVSIRINACFASREESRREVDRTAGACREALGDLIFGEEEQTLEQVVGEMLRSAGRSVATAESCTGGLLAKRLTDVAGSSDFFRQGWITYSNASKQSLLGVPKEVLESHGAVSEQTAIHMARGALTAAEADCALAITGIAGPSGGTPEKPVGVVCIALAHRQAGEPAAEARTFRFPGDREMIRDRSAKMALAMLRYHLMDKPMPF